MGSLMNFVVAGLFLSFLNCNVLSDKQETCLKYRVETMKYIIWTNETGQRNYMKVNFNILLKSQSNAKNEYSIHMRDLEVFIDRENKKPRIDLNNCPSNILPTRLCPLSSLVIVDDDGLFKELRVDRDEPEVCVNIKIYLASLMQINNKYLNGITSSNPNREELFYIGRCPVTYHVNRDRKNTDHLQLVKQIQLDQCSRANGEKEDLKASGTLIMEAASDSSSFVPQVVIYKATWDYIVKGKLKERASVSVDAKAILQDTVSCTAVPSFVDTNAVTVISQHLRPVDRDLVNNDDPENYDLTGVYKTLASDGIAMNIYQDLYERALKCWEII